MAYRVYQRLVIGESFLLEARFLGEDLGGALLRVEAGGGLPLGGFVLGKPTSDSVEISCPETGDFSPGIYSLQLWFDWSGGSLLSEVALDIRLSVEAVL